MTDTVDTTLAHAATTARAEVVEETVTEPPSDPRDALLLAVAELLIAGCSAADAEAQGVRFDDVVEA